MGFCWLKTVLLMIAIHRIVLEAWELSDLVYNVTAEVGRDPGDSLQLAQKNSAEEVSLYWITQVAQNIERDLNLVPFVFPLCVFLTQGLVLPECACLLLPYLAVHIPKSFLHFIVLASLDILQGDYSNGIGMVAVAVLSEAIWLYAYYTYRKLDIIMNEEDQLEED